MRPNLVDEVVAAAMIKKMSADPAVQAQSWRRLRNARWIYSVWQQLPPDKDADAASTVRLIREQGEMGRLKSKIAEAGLPLEAPEEFVTREPLPWRRRFSTSSNLR